MNVLDSLVGFFNPVSGLKRKYAREQLRHYEGAGEGRRTAGWSRNATQDVNAANRPAIAKLRGTARDLVRNNSWARRSVSIIANNTVGWGITGNVDDAKSRLAVDWQAWCESPVDTHKSLTFGGVQHLAVSEMVTAGESLIIRRIHPDRGLVLEMIEAELIDSSRGVDGIQLGSGGEPVGYWIFRKKIDSTIDSVSTMIPAEDVIHLMRVERPGQLRGVTSFAPVILRLKDLDGYEDAVLMRQKIAACFGVMFTDPDGQGALPNGTTYEIAPGMIRTAPPGYGVETITPPSVSDNDGFVSTNLRSVSSGMGITYEEMTGDYSQANFASARMSRLSHYEGINVLRWNTVVPQLCERVYQWFCESKLTKPLPITWIAKPMPMIEPEKEGPALLSLLRTGAITHDEMVTNLGGNPKTHWAQYSKGLELLDTLGIILDSDARKRTQAGLDVAPKPVAAAAGKNTNEN